MPTYIERESKMEQWMFWLLVVPALLLFFVVMTQPAWNSKHLIQQQTDDCKKLGGVQIIDKGLLGDTYSCQPRLDKGVRQ